MGARDILANPEGLINQGAAAAGLLQLIRTKFTILRPAAYTPYSDIRTSQWGTARPGRPPRKTRLD